MRLNNRIAIITGGSQGIGEAICYAYAKEGAVVIITNKNNPEVGIRVATNINDNGGKAEAISCDVADINSVRCLIDNVTNKYGRIDILVNNAGVVVFKKIEDQTLDDWNYVIDTNLKGAFLMSQAVVPIMKKQNSGKIIFVSSVAGSIGFATVAPYSASKGGMLAMAKTMVAELAQHNINVNSISPGNTETPINQQLRDNSEFVEMLAQKTPSGNAYMKPQEIVGAAVFLASDEAKAVHGLDLIVDNGWCAI